VEDVLPGGVVGEIGDRVGFGDVLDAGAVEAGTFVGGAGGAEDAAAQQQ
jgi:hypothetical protein